MKNIFLGLGITAAAIAFAACETTSNTSVNKPLNSNTGAFVNQNAAPTGNSLVNTTSNSNTTLTNGNTKTSTINYNGTAKDNEAERTNIEAEAKKAGRTIGTGASDWWIWSKTRATLLGTNELRDSTIDVDVDNAVVTLTGTVKDAAQKTKAEAVAKTVTDVKSVKNNLKINAGDTILPGTGNTNTNTAAPVKKG